MSAAAASAAAAAHHGDVPGWNGRERRHSVPDAAASTATAAASAAGEIRRTRLI